MIGGSILGHGERWAATVDDLRTVRIIKEQLEQALTEHQKIIDEIKDEIAKSDFASMFQQDVDRCRSVIETCRSRLEQK